LTEIAMSDTLFEKIVDDVKRLSAKRRLKPGDPFARNEYLNNGARFSKDQLYEAGGWTKICIAAGFKPKAKDKVPDEEYFGRLREAIRPLGRYPRTYERKRFGLNCWKPRFPTLPDLIQAAIEAGAVPDLRKNTHRDESDERIQPQSPPPAHTVSAEVARTRTIPPIPLKTKRMKWQRIGVVGFEYAPQDESGVIALFAILCATRVLNWDIVDICGGKGIDAQCWDQNIQRELRVELKHTLTKASWNHSIDDVDCVVCWANRWKDFPNPVIELRSIVLVTHK
jgi:hypothetical protein